jgi:hypothetical protein
MTPVRHPDPAGRTRQVVTTGLTVNDARRLGLHALQVAIFQAPAVGQPSQLNDLAHRHIEMHPGVL